ncbi:MAG: methyltransferase domain-containing protein [Alphaproteobacteria bacterium]|nr:methyltransferase domain-containing protein [Alphaproteobacteria bacterium]
MTQSALSHATKSCRICGNKIDGTPWRVREMLCGTRDMFDYVLCGQCGCLQIAAVPDDLGRYYPQDYYSYRSFKRLAGNRLRRFIDRQRVQAYFGRWNIIGALANRLARPLDYVTWAKRAGLDTTARVLDIGCGNGRVLLRMKLGGFADVAGGDLFIPQTLVYPNGVTIHKMNLEDFAAANPQPFDLIMMHHSLEHVVDPLTTLQTAARLLSANGALIVAVPVADSEACERYREHWISLDAPRHIHLLTRKSMALLAERSGLAIAHIESCGLVSQFIGSEFYRRNLSGEIKRKPEDMFNRSEIIEFQRMTESLNRDGRGDQAMFFMRKAA